MTESMKDDLLRRAHQFIREVLWSTTREGRDWLRDHEATMRPQAHHGALVCPHCFGNPCRCGEPLQEPEPHIYRSTACQHDKHDECRRTCKFCGAACNCECGHKGEPEPTDTQRLDWLESLSAPSISQFGNAGMWQTWKDGRRFEALTFRGLCDAAMAGKPKGTEKG
jgi:hypothetical protein